MKISHFPESSETTQNTQKPFFQNFQNFQKSRQIGRRLSHSKPELCYFGVFHSPDRWFGFFEAGNFGFFLRFWSAKTDFLTIFQKIQNLVKLDADYRIRKRNYSILGFFMVPRSIFRLPRRDSRSEINSNL